MGPSFFRPARLGQQSRSLLLAKRGGRKRRGHGVKGGTGKAEAAKLQGRMN